MPTDTSTLEFPRGLVLRDLVAHAVTDGRYELELDIEALDDHLTRIRVALTAREDLQLAGFRFDAVLSGAADAPIVLAHPNLDQESRGVPSRRLRSGQQVTRGFDQVICSEHGSLIISVERPEEWVTSIDLDARGEDGIRVVIRQHDLDYRADALPVLVRAGETRRSDPVLVGSWEDPYDGLEQHADRLADAVRALAPPVVPAPRGWNSYDYYGWLLNEEIILAEAAAMPSKHGYRHMGLTGPWMDTIGDWRAHPEHFPRGIEPLVSDLHDQGLAVNLWWAPFLVEEDASIFNGDSDWFLRGEGGELLSGSIFEPRRGVRDPALRRTAILDTTHPDALAYLTEVSRRLTVDEGADYLFTDFVRIAQHGGAVRHDPTATGAQAFRRGMRAILTGCRDDVTVMAASGTIGLYPGVCHAGRLGPDITFPPLASPLLLRWTPPGTAPESGFRSVGHPPGVGRVLTSWEGVGGVQAQLAAMASRWYLHGRAFQANPDAVLVSGSEMMAREVARLWAQTGGILLVGDSWLTLDPDRVALLTDRTLLARHATHRFARPVGLFEDDGLNFEGSVQSMRHVWRES